MTRSSVIPTRRSRSPLWLAINIVLIVALGLALADLIWQRKTADQADLDRAAVQGFDHGYAAAMTQFGDTVGAAYGTGYRAAQRDLGSSCPAMKGGAL